MDWSDEELTVFLAIFVSQPFKIGDDNHPECARMARTFGRSTSSIDRQWRNIKHHLFRLDLYGIHANIGGNVKAVIDEYRVDLGRLRQDALDIIDRRGWDLEQLVE